MKLTNIAVIGGASVLGYLYGPALYNKYVAPQTTPVRATTPTQFNNSTNLPPRNRESNAPSTGNPGSRDGPHVSSENKGSTSSK